jgi:hypothetical protein
MSEKLDVNSVYIATPPNSSFTLHSLFKALAAVVHSVRRETSELARHTNGCKSGLARKVEMKKCVSGFRRNAGTVQQLRV